MGERWPRDSQSRGEEEPVIFAKRWARGIRRKGRGERKVREAGREIEKGGRRERLRDRAAMATKSAHLLGGGEHALRRNHPSTSGPTPMPRLVPRTKTGSPATYAILVYELSRPGECRVRARTRARYTCKVVARAREEYRATLRHELLTPWRVRDTSSRQSPCASWPRVRV